MRNSKAVKAVVIGAGIGGLATAAAFRRVGIDAEVWEQAPRLEAAGTGITMGSNAVRALRLLDIDLGFGERRGAFVDTFRILNRHGRTLVETPMKTLTDRIGDPTVCIHRGDLQAGLLEAVEDTPVRLGAVATGFRRTADGVAVDFADGRVAEGDILIGADGINSAVRAQLHGAAEPRRYGGFLCWLATIGYQNPMVTPGWNAQYWGRGRRFGLHDIGQGRVYWWGTINMPEARARSWSGDKQEIARAFAGWAPETAELIERTPLSAIVPVPSQDRSFIERWGRGPVTLLGDAAHPMLTSLGQGGSTAVEDAVVLAKILAAAPDPETGLRAYEDQRRDRTRWMVETSYKLRSLEQVSNPLLVGLRTAMLKYGPQGRTAAMFERALVMPPIPAAVPVPAP